MTSLFLPSRLFNPHHWLLDHLSFYHICSTDTGWISLHHLQSKRLITKPSKSIHGHMLTGQMLTPLSKNRTNAHKIWFWRGKFVNMDIDVIWLITFTARCTIVGLQSTVLPSLCCTADVMWNAHCVDFTLTDCVSALVRWNTTQIIIFKSSSTPAQLHLLCLVIMDT